MGLCDLAAISSPATTSLRSRTTTGPTRAVGTRTTRHGHSAPEHRVRILGRREELGKQSAPTADLLVRPAGVRTGRVHVGGVTVRFRLISAVSCRGGLRHLRCWRRRMGASA
jgi:hypothetical protein